MNLTNKVDDALPEAIHRLNRARLVLSGLDEDGAPAHPGMFDSDVISFAHGEGVRRPHPRVIYAGVRALLDTDESSLDNYLFLKAFPQFEDRIARDFMSQGIDEQIARNVIIDSGTTRLFCAWLGVVSKPGDIFLAAPTFYHGLAKWCHLFRTMLICVPTQRANQYKLTRYDLERFYSTRIRSGELRRPKGLFLFNPTQTGAIYTSTELEELADFALANDLQMVEDCVFLHTCYDDEPVPHLALFKNVSSRVVTFDGGSKAYSLANIRIGWACGPQLLIDAMKAYSVATSATIPHIAKAMALAAMEAEDLYFDVNRNECRERALLVRDCVVKINSTIVKEAGKRIGSVPIRVEHMPRAGHSILLSFNRFRGLRGWQGEPIRDSIDLVRYLLSEARVAFCPGLSSGFSDCTVRLCFGCVGLEYTYQGSKRAEALQALKAVLPFLKLRSLKLQNAIAAECTDLTDAQQNDGFQRGRTLTREALLERVLPALVALAMERSHDIERTTKRLPGNNTDAQSARQDLARS
jgi:aspartate aminotransferase